MPHDLPVENEPEAAPPPASVPLPPTPVSHAVAAGKVLLAGLVPAGGGSRPFLVLAAAALR